MDGYRFYRYLMACRLHFTKPKYSVFETKGNIRVSYESFLKRADKVLIDKIARNIETDRQAVEFISCNFMYGLPDMIYHMQTALSNYKEYLKRKQSLSHTFRIDCQKISECGIIGNGEALLKAKMRGDITHESLVILNDFGGYYDVENNNNMFLKYEILILVKSKGFIRYDREKFTKIYQEELEEAA